MEFEVRRWRPGLRSELAVAGPLFDLKSDLGVEDSRNQEYRGYIRFGRWLKVHASTFKFNFRGLSTLERDITFSDATFLEGTEVSTVMTLQHIKGGVEVDILALREGFLAVVVDYSDFKAKPVNLSSADSSAEETLEMALPTLGLRGRIYLTPALALTAEATGMKRESTGVITDFEGVVTYNLSRNIGVSVGYRNFYAKWLKQGRAVFRMEGYFFSGTVRF
ncbi:MAG: hypothetical protein ACFFC0_10210 [Promethearchaeota archaeon]